MSGRRATEMSDEELEAEISRRGELREIEQALVRYPYVLKLLMNVDPATLAEAAAEIQLAMQPCLAHRVCRHDQRAKPRKSEA